MPRSWNGRCCMASDRVWTSRRSASSRSSILRLPMRRCASSGRNPGAQRHTLRKAQRTAGSRESVVIGGSHRRWAEPDVCGLFLNNVGSWPNGIKLASELLLYELLTQCLPGFDHERKALGPPLLDTRLHPMGACRVHNQRHEWHARTWRAEPPQRIEEADPLHAGVLEPG